MVVDVDMLDVDPAHAAPMLSGDHCTPIALHRRQRPLVAVLCTTLPQCSLFYSHLLCVTTFRICIFFPSKWCRSKSLVGWCMFSLNGLHDNNDSASRVNGSWAVCNERAVVHCGRCIFLNLLNYLSQLA